MIMKTRSLFVMKIGNNIGIVFKERVGSYQNVTYIILGDAAIDDFTPVPPQVSSSAAEPTNLKRWYQNVPQKVPQEPSSGLRNSIAHNDKTNDNSTAPVLDQYNSNFLNELWPEVEKSKPSAIEEFKPKYLIGNTGRASPIRVSLDERLNQFKAENLDRKKIIQNADLKSPEYFKVNKINFSYPS